MNNIAEPFRESKIIALAREIAMDILEVDDILAAHNMTQEDLQALKENPQFCEMLDQMMVEWGSATNTEKRVKFKAASSVENSLLDLYKAANDQSQPLNHRVLALQYLGKLGGLGVEERDVKQAERFSITINMGSERPTVIDGNARALEP